MVRVKTSLADLNKRIIFCTLCPRLRRYCLSVARKKRRAFQDWNYWGKPLPGFGDPNARLLIVGLAPAAHGGNRTGRIFTGDRSGDFLFAALYRAGYANQPASVKKDDGLDLKNCYISAAVRCAPPDNKPLKREMKNCRPYLEEEFELLKNVRVVLALGKIAFDTCLSIMRKKGNIPSRPNSLFKHGAAYKLAASLPFLVASYHPSQRNTQTGLLTRDMMDKLFREIAGYLQ